jgi:hypothetical protein
MFLLMTTSTDIIDISVEWWMSNPGFHVYEVKGAKVCEQV